MWGDFKEFSVYNSLWNVTKLWMWTKCNFGVLLQILLKYYFFVGNVTVLYADVYKRTSKAVLIRWKQFAHYDSRTLLGYVVYSIEAPYKNVTLYDGRDACGGDG